MSAPDQPERFDGDGGVDQLRQGRSQIGSAGRVPSAEDSLKVSNVTAAVAFGIQVGQRAISDVLLGRGVGKGQR